MLKDNVTNAIIKHLTYFANTIKEKLYNKTQMNTILTNFNNDIINKFIKKEDFETKISNRIKEDTKNILFTGIGSQVGTYGLDDSIENYDYLIVYTYLWYYGTIITDSFKSFAIINVKDNVYYTSSLEPQYRIQTSQGKGFYVDFSFVNNKTLKIHTLHSDVSTYEPCIYKIQGIKINNQ